MDIKVKVLAAMLLIPVAALAADGPCVIEGAESAKVSFPEFFDTLRQIVRT